MKNISSRISFKHALPVMDFYAQMLEGKIATHHQFTPEMIAGMKDQGHDTSWIEDAELAETVVHGEVVFGGGMLTFNDDEKAKDYKEEVSFVLNFYEDVAGDSELATKIYNNFAGAKDSIVTIPLAKQFWGSTYGCVRDQYGIYWEFVIAEKAN